MRLYLSLNTSRPIYGLGHLSHLFLGLDTLTPQNDFTLKNERGDTLVTLVTSFKA